MRHMTIYDSHWVIDGGSAQALLSEQGYTVALRRNTRDLKWALMSKPAEPVAVPGRDLD
jgi:hypothetical protein